MFNKKSIISLSILVILIILTRVGYNYLYKDHRNIQSERAEFVIPSQQLMDEFSNNTASSEIKYLNKTLEISGLVTDFNKFTVTLNDGLFCQFQSKTPGILKRGTFIIIKGRCIGFDDLLEEIKLDQCSIINK